MFRTQDNIPIIIEVFIGILTLYSIMPVVAFYIPSSIRSILMFIVLFYFLSNKHTSTKNGFSILPLFYIYILGIVCFIFLSPERILPEIYYCLNLFTLAYVYNYIAQWRDMRLARHLTAIIMIAVVVNAITTYIGNTIYPGASRALASIKYAAEYYDIYQKMNIGGFDVVYSFMFIIPLLAYIYKSYNGKIKFLSVICAVVLLFSIISTEYTTALLVAIASLVLFIVPKDISISRLTFITVAVLFVFFLFGNVANILSDISSISGSEQVADRMNGLLSIFNGQEAGGDIEGRSDMYGMSIQAIISNPIIGGWKQGALKTGGHSLFLDTIADYGIIGIFAIFSLYKIVYNRIVAKCKNTDIYLYSYSAFFIYLILTCLNPQPYIIYIGYVVPLLIWYFEQQTKPINN